MSEDRYSVEYIDQALADWERTKNEILQGADR